MFNLNLAHPTNQQTQKEQSQLGQGGVIAVAMTVLVALVILGGSMSLMRSQNAARTLVDQRSLQVYYVAMAGIQQALATRMVPASNALNWSRPNGVLPLFGSYQFPAANTPTNEGLVCNNPAGTVPCPNNNISGVYRYFVLNGDPGVNAAASNNTAIQYWGDMVPNGLSTPQNPQYRKTAWLNLPTSSDDSAPEFYVVSKGYTCVQVDATGRMNGILVPGAMTPGMQGFASPQPGTMPVPTCSPVNGVVSQLNTLTLIARVQLNRDNGQTDRILGIQLVKDDSSIDVGRKVYVPGTGWTDDAFVFEDVYGYSGGATANPATPSHVVFYEFTTSKIICSKNITGSNTTITNADCAAGIAAGLSITPKTAIRLFFQGPIDHRSLSNVSVAATNKQWRDYDLKGCDSGSANYSNGVAFSLNNSCRILVHRVDNSALVPNFKIKFYPPQNTVVDIRPTLQSLPTPTQYVMSIDSQRIRSWTGSGGPASNYTINFTVN